MDTCAMCGVQAENLPFIVSYNATTKEWEYSGGHLCRDCANLAAAADLDEEDKKEDEESERFHAWADTQR